METGIYDMEKEDQPIRPTENVLTQKRLKSYSLELHAENRENKQSVIRSTIAIVISIILFLLHWRLVSMHRQDRYTPS